MWILLSSIRMQISSEVNSFKCESIQFCCYTYISRQSQCETHKCCRAHLDSCSQRIVFTESCNVLILHLRNTLDSAPDSFLFIAWNRYAHLRYYHKIWFLSKLHRFLRFFPFNGTIEFLTRPRQNKTRFKVTYIHVWLQLY